MQLKSKRGRPPNLNTESLNVSGPAAETPTGVKMLLEERLDQFLKELHKFDYTLSSSDHVWKILFKNNRDKWGYLHVNKYREIFYLSHVDGACGTLEVEPEKSPKIMDSGGFSASRSFYENEPLQNEWTAIINDTTF